MCNFIASSWRNYSNKPTGGAKGKLRFIFLVAAHVELNIQ